MNREIKFRIWCDLDKKMLYTNEDIKTFAKANNEDWFRVKWADFTDLHLLQYTGLKDKNGKEIYEGDIIKSGAGLVYEVVWWDEKVAWATKDKFGGYNMLWPEVKQWDEVEIISNIYENPKLIKNQDV